MLQQSPDTIPATTTSLVDEEEEEEKAEHLLLLSQVGLSRRQSSRIDRRNSGVRQRHRLVTALQPMTPIYNKSSIYNTTGDALHINGLSKNYDVDSHVRATASSVGFDGGMISESGDER